jgi:ABC-2 type transport system permease protein
MMAIFRREVAAYFNSAMAWTLMAVYMFVVGQMFVQTVVTFAEYSLTAGSSPFGAPPLSLIDRIMVPTFWWMGFLLLFMLPLLTMRLIAEESRTGTLEMLFTYPLTEAEIVMGKFAGAMSVVVAMMTMSASLFVALAQLVTVEWKVVASGFLGVFLMSCAFVSFGIWASSISSSQVLAAAISYGGLLSSWLVVMVTRDMENVKEVFGDISVFANLQQMAQGTLSTHQFVYYLAWTGLFLFLTIRMLESRKWGG